MRKTAAIVVFLFLPGAVYTAAGQTLLQSRHNLSVNGPGSVRAATETEVCIFCHTPHVTSGPVAPLWNRNDAGVVYTLYNSSTIDAVPGQPDGSSILCLSCHDGTTALGSVRSRENDIELLFGVTTMPPQSPANLGTDLSDDHPVSFEYDPSLATKDGQLTDPTTLVPPVTLENGKMQCTSCHDPHSEVYDKFLVVTNENSDLCMRCHDRDYWASSSHSTSSATWNGSGTDPWPHTPYTTVAENGCENCHNPHSAQGKARIMNYLAEENNCLFCHNGNVSQKDISAEVHKSYVHNVFPTTAVHDPTEDAVVQNMHVECEDCHNPHAVRHMTATAPDVSGALTGVKGVNLSGVPVYPAQYEYEICFRCHADSPNKPNSYTPRDIEQNNTRLEFDLNNPSYHPVEGPGKNPNVPSLISPLNENSVIYCTDCHASDGTDAPKGPHGSNFFPLVKYAYQRGTSTDPYVDESPLAYELCYSCHDRTSILNDESFPHYRHVVQQRTPCNVCHDPHGISNTQGNSTNHSHLINFDVHIVSADRFGRLYFEDLGTYSGRCFLRCHGRNHPARSY